MYYQLGYHNRDVDDLSASDLKSVDRGGAEAPPYTRSADSRHLLINKLLHPIPRYPQGIGTLFITLYKLLLYILWLILASYPETC